MLPGTGAEEPELSRATRHGRYKMVTSDLEFADLAYRVGQACLARRGRQRGDRIVFCCPVHNDGNPSAEYRVSKGVGICRSCFAGGGLVTGEVPLARKLGIRSHSDPSRPIPVPPPPTPEPTESAMRARERLSGWFAARTGTTSRLASTTPTACGRSPTPSSPRRSIARCRCSRRCTST